MENRRLVHELLDAVIDARETGDHVHLAISDMGYGIFASHIAGGFDTHKKYDLYKGCNLDETEKIQELIAYFRNIKKALTPASN